MRPNPRQLGMEEGGNPWRLRGSRHGDRARWAHRPRAEPGRQTLAEHNGQPQARIVVGATATECDPPQRFVARHQHGDRHRRRRDDRGGAQRRFFSSRWNARSRVRRWTARPKRA